MKRLIGFISTSGGWKTSLATKMTTGVKFSEAFLTDSGMTSKDKEVLIVNMGGETLFKTTVD